MVGRLDTVKSNQVQADADLEMSKTVPVSREQSVTLPPVYDAQMTRVRIPRHDVPNENINAPHFQVGQEDDAIADVLVLIRHKTEGTRSPKKFIQSMSCAGVQRCTNYYCT